MLIPSRPTTPARPLLVVLAAAALTTVTACGGDDPADDSAAAASDLSDDVADAMDSATEAIASATSEEEATEVAEDLADDLVDDLESAQEAMGGGSATLTFDGQTWEFDSVLCAIGEEQTGQEGAEFVLSALQDGLQLYVSVDSFGHSVTLDDVENFADPSVALASREDGDFLQIDGTDVSADFVMAESEDYTGETEARATLAGTCP